MADLTPYTWQQAQWQRLKEQRASDLLPHALLLYGQQGLGLNHFAYCFLASLACQAPTDEGIACGECPACRQFGQGVYPDFMKVEPAEEKSAILVDQVRALNEFIGLTQGSGRKLVLLSPADKMNVNAANSLLKTLEEPSGNTVIVLVAHSLSRLPATIRSRCQLVKFAKPSPDQAREWLEQRSAEHIAQLLRLTNGAPCLAESLDDAVLLHQYQACVMALLEALESRRTVLELRKLLKDVDIGLLVDWIQSVLRDMLRAFHNLSDARFENSAHLSALRRLSGLLDFGSVFAVTDRFAKIAASVDHPLNPELFLDDVIQTWMQLAEKH